MKPEARFRQLFEMESEWSQEDILPFIEFTLLISIIP